MNRFSQPRIGAEDVRTFLADHRTHATSSELDRLLERWGNRTV